MNLLFCPFLGRGAYTGISVLPRKTNHSLDSAYENAQWLESLAFVEHDQAEAWDVSSGRMMDCRHMHFVCRLSDCAKLRGVITSRPRPARPSQSATGSKEESEIQ